jgi:hypothetical protein
MYSVIPRIPSKFLADKVQRNAQRDPQHTHARIHHDRSNVPVSFDPDVQELGETVGPEILVDGGGDKELARDRLVRIDLAGQY